MQPFSLSKQSDSGCSPYRLLLSFGLPILTLLAFVGQHFINFDIVGWNHGFSHPLTGWDHLVTMLAVGIWAAQLRGRAVWMLPLAFVGVMSLGGLAGAAGLAIPSVEGIILLSTAVFSVLITRKIRFHTSINVCIVAFFAFFHGFAHGQEVSTSASLISYTLGFMLATLLLHGAGILLAKLVVLSITCLLTVLFSSAALAKTAESIIDVQDKNSAFSCDTEDCRKTTYKISTAETRSTIDIAENPSYFQKNGRHSVGQDNHPPGASKQANPPCVSLITVSNDIAKSFRATGNELALILKSSSLKAWRLCQLPTLSIPDNECIAVLDFKHSYPDINHTPGRHLLSNGVGLTSPPILLRSALPSQVSPNFCKSSPPSIEVADLQLILAKPNIGNPYTRIFKDFKHDCSVRNLCVALLDALTREHYQNHFLSNSNPTDRYFHSDSIALNVIFKYQFSGTIRYNSTFHNRIMPHSGAHSNITIKTKRLDS